MVCLFQPKHGTGAVSSANMPPPKVGSIKKRRHKRSSEVTTTGFRSVPTTPSQQRAHSMSAQPIGKTNRESDSDSACGFDSNWKEGDGV